MHQTFSPGRFCQHNSQPAIVWWRYGVAATGEPSIVERIQVYPDAATRDAAVFEAKPA